MLKMNLGRFKTDDPQDSTGRTLLHIIQCGFIFLLRVKKFTQQNDGNMKECLIISLLFI